MNAQMQIVFELFHVKHTKVWCKSSLDNDLI
jgi:hypothetical protein